MNDNGRYLASLEGIRRLNPRLPNIHEKICSVVALVPRGQVATYGQIAGIVGCSPRQVGYALAALMSGTKVPWQRIINRYGRISVRSDGQPDAEQRRQLQEEGIVFDTQQVIDLSVYRWDGPSWEWLDRYGSDSSPLS